MCIIAGMCIIDARNGMCIIDTRSNMRIERTRAKRLSAGSLFTHSVLAVFSLFPHAGVAVCMLVNRVSTK